MQNYVLDNGLDVGFAYDGDADRCLAVDEKGNVVTGDHIMFLCGKYLREMGQLRDDMVVTTVMSNLGLYKALEAEGMKYQQTAVGDKYVAENMMANSYNIGGEQSGHIIFRKYATTGDGILTSLMVMQAMKEKKSSLSKLAGEMKMYPQVLKNVVVKDKAAAQANEKVRAAVQAAADALGQDGRILVRESGTEPKIRVMVEAKSHEDCEKYVDSVIAVIRAEGLAQD
jgi:phosphoglucosamine mutase